MDQPKPGDREEVTDIINEMKKRYTPERFDSMGIKKGKLLRFRGAKGPVDMVITRVAKGRYWAKHVVLPDQKAVLSHYGHNVDTTAVPPWCSDCEIPISELSTEDGDKKALDRKDRQLDDGTPIPSA